MQGNIAVLGIQKFYDNSALKNKSKPAKLSTYKTFYKKTTELQNSVLKENVAVNDSKVEVKENKPEQSNTPVSVNSSNVQANVPNTKMETTNSINITLSEERLSEIENKLNVQFYKELNAQIVNLTTYRRLKVALLVVNTLKKAISYANKVIKLLEDNKEEVKNEPIDFSSFPNVTKFPGTFVEHESTSEKEVSQSKVNDNIIKFPGAFVEHESTHEKAISQPKVNDNVRLDIDKFLNKETNNIENSQSDDADIVEINSLMQEKAKTEESLQTQREILADLRRKIEQNKVLCETKKQELREENMALTRELNDILAEINQLSDIANQQEAFLDMSNESENTYGRRVA